MVHSDFVAREETILTQESQSYMLQGVAKSRKEVKLESQLCGVCKCPNSDMHCVKIRILWLISGSRKHQYVWVWNRNAQHGSQGGRKNTLIRPRVNERKCSHP